MAAGPKHSSYALTEVIVGLLAVIACLLVLFVWIPLDVETSFFEKVRRRIEIGDAFAPGLAAGLLGLGGVLLLVEGVRGKGDAALSRQNVLFVAGLIIGATLFIQLLTWPGPLAVSLFGPADAEYRLLRDTAPWKYVGYIAGGTMMITALFAFVEHRFHWRQLAVALIATLILAAVYDLPFDDLLLPPNGDF